MTIPEVERALGKIERLLDGIENRPEMYGAHPESLETQVRQAVAMRQLLWGYEDFLVNRAIASFTSRVNGDFTNHPLWAILKKEGMLDQLPHLLGDFARWVAQEYPPKTRK